jgi:hypothetical protein
LLLSDAPLPALRGGFVDFRPAALQQSRRVKRFCAILLLLAVAGLGSGALRHVHDVAHAHQDLASTEHRHDHDAPAPANRHHDSTNCTIHAKLSFPLVMTGHVPLLIGLGLIVAFLSQLTPAWVSRFTTLRLECRGPPVC